SDGDRASSFIMDGLLDPEDDSIYLMIKNKSVKEVAKFNPSSYLLGGNWVHFSDENDAVLIVRNVLGSYPSESVLELTESVRGKPITLPVSDLTEAIDLTEFMAESKLKSERNIEVRITTTKLSCYGKKDKGEASCEVDYESGLKEGE
ncbi:hypothetical protein KA005_46350, partial [bacterium]|nr:hypothetical protein [bacterium]